MLHLLTPSGNGVESITFATNSKPATNPSSDFSEYLNSLPPEKACEVMALCCVAGGVMEIIIMDEHTQLFKDIYCIFQHPEYIVEYNKIELILNGMGSDLQRMNDYYSEKGISTPDLNKVVEKAIPIFVDYICKGGDSIISELSNDILDNYSLEQGLPIKLRNTYSIFGDTLSQSFRIDVSAKYEIELCDMYRQILGIFASFKKQQTIMQTFRTDNRAEWRQWLAEHFETETEVLFVFPAISSGEESISYNDAVEEALCFGWIDGVAGTLNSTHNTRRFTPRRKGSSYSRPNIERLIWLEQQNMIHPKIRVSVLPIIQEPYVFPEDILAEIQKDAEAWEHFNHFTASYQRIRIAYIDAARHRPEEFQKRLANFIRKTKENKLIMGYGGIEKYYK